MNTDRKLAWISLVIGLLGLFPWLQEQIHNRNYQLAITYGSLIALLFIFFGYTLRSGKGPHYETLQMKKILTLLEDGQRAEVRREQTIRARYDNLQGIWWKGNIVDGSMRDFAVDGKNPDRIESVGCSRSLYKEFRPPLSKGERITVIWTFQADNSFPSGHESFSHETIPATRNLEMVIHFPDKRRCVSEKFHVEVAGDDARPHDGLEKRGEGKLLVATVRTPKPGHTYTIDWIW